MLNLSKKNTIDLVKSVKQAKIKNNLQNQKAQVVIVLDNSGSMTQVYENGQVQLLLDRLVALASEFDDDGSATVYSFHDSPKYHGEVKLNQMDNFIEKNVSKYRGGTNYADVIEDVISKCTSNFIPKAKSWFEFNLGPSPKFQPVNLPVYVIFITDGDTSNKELVTAKIQEASTMPIFWQFVGIGHAGFHFLQQLDDMKGRYIDNADFFVFNGEEPDQILFDRLMTEFPHWIEEARKKNLLK